MWWLWIPFGIAVIAIVLYLCGLLKLLRKAESEEEGRVDYMRTIPPGGRPVVSTNENVWIILLVDIAYYIRTRKDIGETALWLEEYDQYGVTCAECNALIFPMHPVGKVGGKYYHAGAFQCAPPRSDWGVLDAEGTPIPSRHSGLTLDEEVLKSGLAPVEAVETAMPTLDQCDYILYGLVTSDKSRNYG